MKNLIKTISISSLGVIMAVAIFVPAMSAHAALPEQVFDIINNGPILQVSNYTLYPNQSVWSRSVSVNAGEIVSFIVSYHALQTANNTIIKVELPTLIANQRITVTGKITADGVTASDGVTRGAVFGTSQITSSSNQTLTYMTGSTVLYKGGSNATPTIIADGITNPGTTGGVNIGNVANGESGFVVFRATVSGNIINNNPTAPTVTTLNSNVNQNSATLNATVNPNGSPTNAWFQYDTNSNLTNAMTVGNQSLGSGNTTQNFTYTFPNNLNSNTTYYFRVVAQNNSGTNYGTILSFTTQNTGTGMGNIPTITYQSQAGAGVYGATLYVTINPNNAATDYWFIYGTNQSQLNFTSATYQMQASGTATNGSAYIQNLNPNTVYWYQAIARNQYGTAYGTIQSLTTLPGSSGTATITTNDASSIGQNSATLNATVNPNNTTATVQFQYGTDYQFNNSMIVGSQSISGNYSQSVSYTLYNLNQGTTYYFRAITYTNNTPIYGEVRNFTTNQSYVVGLVPTVTTNNATLVLQNSAVLNSSVNPNGLSTTVWFEFGTVNGSLTNTAGYQSVTFNSNPSTTLINLLPNTTYYYRIAATNSAGTVYGSTTSFTTNQITYTTNTQTNTQIQSVSSPLITTLSASHVYSTSAMIRGSINPNNSPTNTWFEWGTDTNVINKTYAQATGNGSAPIERFFTLISLRPNTTYYFRTAAQNNNGTSYGTVLSFTTTSYSNVSSTASTGNTVTSTTTATSANNMIALTSKLDKEEQVVNGEIVYTITYKNDKDAPINNAILRVFLPNEVEYTNPGIAPSVLEGDNILRFDLGDIAAKTQGILTIKAKIKSDAAVNSEINFNTVLSYTNPENKSKSVTINSTATLKIKEAVSLAASAVSLLGSIFTKWYISLILGLAVGGGAITLLQRKKVSVI